jgi:hypothetical protein
MTPWILVLVFIHQEGVHSLQVPFGTEATCAQAAAHWRSEYRGMVRVRTIEAKCHATGYR